MTSPNMAFAFVVKIDFKQKVSPYTVTSRYFSVSNYEENELYSGQDYKAYGLLRSITGLGSLVEDVIPTERTGTIELDNTRGGTGYNRRFADWLDKEEIVGQPITVYYLRLDIDDKGGSPDTSLQTEFVGIVLPWRAQPGQSTISLNVVNKFLTPSFPQYQIASTTAPIRSQGRYLPMIFGAAKVPTYPLDGAQTNTRYAYATKDTLVYHVGGVTNYYAKDHQGDFVEVLTGPGVSTAAIDLNATGTTYVDTTWVIKTERAYPIVASTKNYIITQARWQIYGTAGFGGTIDGQLVLRIYEQEITSDRPGVMIGAAEREKATFDGELRLAAGFNVDFVFTKPIVLRNDRNYYVSVEETKSGGSYVVHNRVYQPAAGTDNFYGREGSSGIQADWLGPFALVNHLLDVKLYGVVLTDSPTAVSGFAYFTCTQKAAIGGLSNPNLHELNLVVKATGLLDGPGTISGTASLDLGTSAGYVIKLLGTIFGGASIDISTFDVGNVTRTTYPRRVDGASKGRASATDIISAIARSSLCKLVPRRNGDLAVWAYGAAQTPSHYFSEKDCKLKEISSTAVEGVVNTVAIAYAETAIPLNIEDIQTGQPRNFEETLDWDYLTGTPQAAWSTDSFNLFGERSLSNGFVQLPWIREDGSAEFFGKSTMTVSKKPRWKVEIEVPFIGKGYDASELMDLANLTHIDMPNELGTSAEGVTPFPVENGVPSTNVNEGDIWHEAKNYVCRIVGRKVNFNINNDEGPTIDLVLHVLDNPMEIR